MFNLSRSCTIGFLKKAALELSDMLSESVCRRSEVDDVTGLFLEV